MVQYFPDGSEIGAWFSDELELYTNTAEKRYVVTDYGVVSDGTCQTKLLQQLIDNIALSGGGILVIPKGIFVTGALFFKKGVNLLIEKDGVLKGSEDICEYPIMNTRIEGESCLYYSALINADGLDGFKIYGTGTIDGNGERAWKAFWKRREWNPNCTNKDEQRPRLVYLSNCENSVVTGVRLINSHFWTLHIYKCEKTKIFDCSFYSQKEPVPAPSTDAIDIDACVDVHIKNCVFEVNDDGVALKGGKGPKADVLSENGANERIIIEDCTYNFCHGCLTCGSEAIHNKNVIVRRINVKSAMHLLWLKMRPDTPQHYEYVLFDGVKGEVDNFLDINPWTQFFNLNGEQSVPVSVANNIFMKNCDIKCDTFLNVTPADTQYSLSDFIFENLYITTQNSGFKKDVIKNAIFENVVVKGEKEYENS